MEHGRDVRVGGPGRDGSRSVACLCGDRWRASDPDGLRAAEDVLGVHLAEFGVVDVVVAERVRAREESHRAMRVLWDAAMRGYPNCGSR